LGHTDKFAITILNKKNEKNSIRINNERDLISVNKIIDRRKIFRIKGIHSILALKNVLYVSCFDHSQEQTKFWYDIINLDTNKVISTITTPFLFNFIKDGKHRYVYKDVGPFQLFRIK